MNLRGMFAAAAMAIGSFAAMGCSAPVVEQASENLASAATADASSAFVYFRSWFRPTPVVRARPVFSAPVARYTARPAYSYVGVRYAPPAARYEVVRTAPSTKHFFVPGHWKWTGGKYTWIGGHWDTKRSGRVYVHGHWNKVNGHYYYKPGHWRSA